MTKRQKILDGLILRPGYDKEDFIEIEKNYALTILSEIEKTFVLSSEVFEWDAMRALLDYYIGENNKLLLLVETGRKIDRKRSGDKSGLSILGTATRDRVISQSRSLPALILLQQEGTLELNWSGHKFWWPILAAPATTEPCVFASKVAA